VHRNEHPIEDLRSARQKSGLSQAAIAARMGTTQSAIARIEAIGSDPRLSTVERYVRALGGRLVFAEQTATLARTAAEVATLVTADAPGDAFRLAIQFIDDFEALDEHGQLIAVRDEPALTGSKHWDAFLAGLAEYVAVRHGIPVPGWASSPARFLADFWFVIEDILGRPAQGLAAIAYATAPPSFANRGVFLDRSALVSV
jgi:transcriptional regulator with XRE-family HTH domain